MSIEMVDNLLLLALGTDHTAPPVCALLEVVSIITPWASLNPL